MSEISGLQPQKVWHFFDLICSIPHISKHESALAEALAKEAEQFGLAVVKDITGNVIIRRKAAAGMEKSPGIILQAHMDMVPASEKEFDFLHTPISPVIDGEWVRACGTTLGADDGIGVAHAMAIITDPDFAAGELTVILTVDEEAGMSGAANLDPAYLRGKYMINLDGGDRGFCIGCAGGARQKFYFKRKLEDTDRNLNPFRLYIDGLPGGHSGLCIDQNRGNAIKFMAEFIEQFPEMRIAEFTGGTADNAIPYQASAVVLTDKNISELRSLAEAFLLTVKSDCPAAGNMTLDIKDAPGPEQCWQMEMQQQLLNAVLLAPNEVIDFDQQLNIVKTSSNLAMINSVEDRVVICTSQRSLVDSDRDAICGAMKTHFELFGAVAELGSVYPATPPDQNSPMLKLAMECAAENDKSAFAYAIHAGLETGWFSLKNPELEIISCGPESYDYHTPKERLNIASVGKFDRFLRELILKLAR